MPWRLFSLTAAGTLAICTLVHQVMIANGMVDHMDSTTFQGAVNQMKDESPEGRKRMADYLADRDMTETADEDKRKTIENSVEVIDTAEGQVARQLEGQRQRKARKRYRTRSANEKQYVSSTLHNTFITNINIVTEHVVIERVQQRGLEGDCQVWRVLASKAS